MEEALGATTDPLLGDYLISSQRRSGNRVITRPGRKFDINTLDKDMKRVYKKLEEEFGEEYALLVIFTMRTAVELHRAWNMTLLTNRVLQLIKQEFDLRMTWELGVVKLKFRMEDGGYELHRKVPYDYDAEYQDIYYRVARALVEREITVQEALSYQAAVKNGDHTTGIGRFIRDLPGRLVVYPLLSSMCAIIFFGGTWDEAGVAAICGIASGVIDYTLSKIGGQASLLLDIIVGLATGVIGGLWYSYVNPICLASVFLGTLYWFFYGTAFVIGLLEIMVGELETGVTRFIAVSVKTFVLSLGASLGLMLAGRGTNEASTWFESGDYCQSDFVAGNWWRIPIYLLSSVGVLGQYRLQINRYWCVLLVQLAAYEIQYQVFRVMQKESIESVNYDHLDTATSNILGALGGVFSACVLSWLMDTTQAYYSALLLAEENPRTKTATSKFIYGFMEVFVKILSKVGINRKSELQKQDLEQRIRSAPSGSFELTGDDEKIFLETIIGAQDNNVWSFLMPAVYQLVPGSIIARLWFQAIFLVNPSNSEADISSSQESVFANLMVISTSLAIGLLIGFALVIAVRNIFRSLHRKQESDKSVLRNDRKDFIFAGMNNAVGSFNEAYTCDDTLDTSA